VSASIGAAGAREYSTIAYRAQQVRDSSYPNQPKHRCRGFFQRLRDDIDERWTSDAVEHTLEREPRIAGPDRAARPPEQAVEWLANAVIPLTYHPFRDPLDRVVCRERQTPA
jgi:hypothetical protein